ncbi:hypothetical protein BHF71_02190 [Vulcanibacillus modesticaldus]|uniref:Uncharacterized protein n=1 Tax=Vulcanibacillus modesticaldus TaxID=337097 RepID=A0A1D2YUT6_9BACI|nr:hypothetical protein BHF71_02190 [Vulcanibacillus modesticaldus]
MVATPNFLNRTLYNSFTFNLCFSNFLGIRTDTHFTKNRHVSKMIFLVLYNNKKDVSKGEIPWSI